jgi:hypothetical protein
MAPPTTRPRVVLTLQIASDLLRQERDACDVTLLPASAVTSPAALAAALAAADGVLLSQPVTIAGLLLDERRPHPPHRQRHHRHPPAMHALVVRNLLRALGGDLPETPLNPEVRTTPGG